ncbi:Replication factor-A C terminal domain-containing protein [Forsythia ovata]|uniref:Replication factor-A C terminal domain-containing protein n=1 Tax=Forsythia ovata TaxID=205694 RepID=A0ABD1PY13_9LAMI
MAYKRKRERIATNPIDNTHSYLLFFQMNTTESSSKVCERTMLTKKELKNKHRRELYAQTKEARNTRKKELRREAEKLRDTRRKERHFERHEKCNNRSKQLRIKHLNHKDIAVTLSNEKWYFSRVRCDIKDHLGRVDENVENLNRLIVEKSYFIASPAKVPIPDDNKITDIKNISGLHHMQTYFWVKAKANLQKQEQAYWYMSCSNCNKLSGADANEVFECVFCKFKQAHGAPRARATIQLQDATSSLLATVIRPPAETFFQCSAYDLMKGTTPNEKSDIVEKMRTSIEEDMLFYVKVVPKEKEEGYKYDVVFIMNPSETPGKTTYIESGKNNTPDSASSDLVPYAPVTPTSKRVLFQEEYSATSSSKKKQSDKDENIGQSTSDEGTMEESYYCKN